MNLKSKQHVRMVSLGGPSTPWHSPLHPDRGERAGCCLLFLGGFLPQTQNPPSPITTCPPLHLKNAHSFLKAQLKYFLNRAWSVLISVSTVASTGPGMKRGVRWAGVILPMGMAPEAIFLPGHPPSIRGGDP